MTAWNERASVEFNPAMNQSDATDKPIPFAAGKRWLSRFVLVLLSLCAAAVWLLWPAAMISPSITFLPSGHAIQAQPMPIPDRWIPMTWGWLWKVRYALFPKPADVHVETSLVRFGAASETLLREFLNDRVPLTSSNGVRGWVLPEKELKEFGRGIAQERGCTVYAGRMSLGAGVLATMSMTTTPQAAGVPVPTGNVWSCAVRPRNDSVELTGSYTSWDIAGMFTNLTLAATMQVPRGQMVFLYDTNGTGAHRSSVGLLIHPVVK